MAKATRPKRVWIVGTIMLTLCGTIAVRAVSWACKRRRRGRFRPIRGCGCSDQAVTALAFGATGVGLFAKWRWSRWGAVAFLGFCAASGGWVFVACVASTGTVVHSLGYANSGV